MQRSSVAHFLRNGDRRVTGHKQDLVSPSYAWRRDKERHTRDAAFAARKAEFEGRRVARFRDWRKNGILEGMRARGLDDVADHYEAEMVGID
ncbi:hypothetical protein [Allomesorhizobium alhagi]|uniref:Uncharacterized protein n=1 Tax=Mesorhizobium alhagi CCNWXJ12-2 TaxID=1107882 RepID=H0HQX8_9HYPH|nr:hypothetical protein [Mesorhizobium alhagi]EHK56840.1 hypothetical protein MAXJ12_12802 [Mesorhizobium alhagi CCNWXJ12-2]